MSYVTVEVEIDHGRIVVKDPEKLPQTGAALLTFMHGENSDRKPLQKRPFGLAKGLFEVPDNFNDPLPESILREFEGR